MSETESFPVSTSPVGGIALHDDPDQHPAEIDFGAATIWLREHVVLTGGLLIIIAEIIWKGQFLSQMYFSQDDYVNLDIAIKSPFDWHYLSLIGAGHFYPALRPITCLLAPTSLYTCALNSASPLPLVALP